MRDIIDSFEDVPLSYKSKYDDAYNDVDRVLKWVERGIIPFEAGVARIHYILATRMPEGFCNKIENVKSFKC